MPSEQDLVGIGVTPELARLLGLTPQTIAGLGTTQATAAPIYKTLALVTAAGSATGAILPSGAPLNTLFVVVGIGSTAPVVYAPVGHSMNGTLNGKATFSASPGVAIFIRTSSTAWVTAAAVTTTVS